LGFSIALDEWPKQVFSTVACGTNLHPEMSSRQFTKRILIFFSQGVRATGSSSICYDSFLVTEMNWVAMMYLTSVAQSFQHPRARLQKFADIGHGFQQKFQRLSTQASLSRQASLSNLTLHQRCNLWSFFTEDAKCSS